MRLVALILLAVLAAPVVASAQGLQCASGSQSAFRRSSTPYKIAKITDARNPGPGGDFTITSTSADAMTCGQAESHVGCQVAGPALVKIEHGGDVAFFEVPVGRTAAVSGPKPLACELD